MSDPKPVGDFREMVNRIVEDVQELESFSFDDFRLNHVHDALCIDIERALNRLAAETEARVRAETIEECAKVCEFEAAEYCKSRDRFDNLGDIRTGNLESHCAMTAKHCADQVRALASNRSREGGSDG